MLRSVRSIRSPTFAAAGGEAQPNTAKPTCIWGGGLKNTEWEFWPRRGGQQKTENADLRCTACPQTGQAGPLEWLGMAGLVLEMGKAAPQFCAAKSWNGENGTAQRRYRQERRGEASRLGASPSEFGGFICASFAVSGKGGKETRVGLVGATPGDPVHPIEGTYPLPRSVHGCSQWCPCFSPPFPPRPNVTLLRVPVD